MQRSCSSSAMSVILDCTPGSIVLLQTTRGMLRAATWASARFPSEFSGCDQSHAGQAYETGKIKKLHEDVINIKNKVNEALEREVGQGLGLRSLEGM